MHTGKHRARRLRKGVALAAVLAPIGAVAAAVIVPSSSAIAASQTFTNACRNSAVGANWDQINVTMTASSPPGPVAAGSSVSLTGLGLDMAVPGAIFVAGYNLGLLTVGANSIPAHIHEVIDATNTVEGSQSTNTVDTTLSTTISDPDGTPGSGDETATDASASVTFNNQTWTAGASGTINFAEHNDSAITGVAGGGVVAVADIGAGLIHVQFHCTSGTVVNGGQPAPPAVVTFTNAPTVTSTTIGTQVNAPTVTALNPTHGPAAGGNSVVITGTDLTGATAVAFGATAATTFTVDSNTQITATAPPGTAGNTVDVTVTTPAGTSPTTGTGNDYTYDAVVPPSGVDAAMNVLVHGPIFAMKDSKNVDAMVTNAGTVTTTVCTNDITWFVTVNGAPTGSVAVKTPHAPSCRTMEPGESAPFHFVWLYGSGALTGGDTVEFTATVSVTGDGNAANNTDTETRNVRGFPGHHHGWPCNYEPWTLPTDSWSPHPGAHADRWVSVVALVLSMHLRMVI